MKKYMLGKKVGMTQIFNEEGLSIPVTAIKAGPCVVIQKKTMENDGYTALKLGFEDIPERKANKPKSGEFKKYNISPKRYIREFRTTDIDNYENGQEIKITDMFSRGDRVDVTGVSKGKGFQGVIKRHGFSRGRKTHGSTSYRRVGSMGAGTDPGKVFKGKKLPGRMGGEKVTIQNLDVVGVDGDKDLLLLKGSVPGIRNSLLIIKETVKAKSR